MPSITIGDSVSYSAAEFVLVTWVSERNRKSALRCEETCGQCAIVFCDVTKQMHPITLERHADTNGSGRNFGPWLIKKY